MQRWNGSLWVFTEEEYNQLPDGIVLTCIGGETVTKGIDDIDMDTRFGHIAFGVYNPTQHPEAELFTTFILSGVQSVDFSCYKYYNILTNKRGY